MCVCVLEGAKVEAGVRQGHVLSSFYDISLDGVIKRDLGWWYTYESRLKRKKGKCEKWEMYIFQSVSWMERQNYMLL